MEAGGLPTSDNGLGPKTPSASQCIRVQDISRVCKYLSDLLLESRNASVI